MKQNQLVLSEIHPNKGDKYSPNLHAYLSASRNSVAHKYAHLYLDKDGTQWLGYQDDTDCFVGLRLSQALCYGAKAKPYAYLNLGPLTEVEGFWGRYAQIGRCAIDPDHNMGFVGDETRWIGSGEHRSCQWCGKAHQHRETTSKTVEVTKQRWVNAPAL